MLLGLQVTAILQAGVQLGVFDQMPTSAEPGSCSTRSPRSGYSNAMTAHTGSPRWQTRS
jgi:hypothetical protein